MRNRRSLLAHMRGRLSRRAYIISTLVYFVVLFVMFLLAPDPAKEWVEMLMPFVWVLGIAFPRFHDFGASGWWAFTPMVAGMVGGALNGAGVIPNAAFTPVSVALSLFTLGFMIWLGARRGDPGPNRFDDQGDGEAAADTFS